MNRLPKLRHRLRKRKTATQQQVRHRSAAEKGLGDWGYGIPNGGIFSTPKDVVALSRAIVTGKLVSKHSRDMMWTNETSASWGYGLGFFVLDDEANKDYVFHSGSTDGYSCVLAVNKKYIVFVGLIV